mmetsp:Transcript_93281/g.241114  ORF Transcript_93281/g.241114 Transcript_93281/m.241114 type:complete len:388 (-) Transcript_93281:549-1712(-)
MHRVADDDATCALDVRRLLPRHPAVHHGGRQSADEKAEQAHDDDDQEHDSSLLLPVPLPAALRAVPGAVVGIGAGSLSDQRRVLAVDAVDLRVEVRGILAVRIQDGLQRCVALDHYRLHLLVRPQFEALVAGDVHEHHLAVGPDVARDLAGQDVDALRGAAGAAIAGALVDRRGGVARPGRDAPARIHAPDALTHAQTWATDLRPPLGGVGVAAAARSLRILSVVADVSRGLGRPTRHVLPAAAVLPDAVVQALQRRARRLHGALVLALLDAPLRLLRHALRLRLAGDAADAAVVAFGAAAVGLLSQRRHFLTAGAVANCAEHIPVARVLRRRLPAILVELRPWVRPKARLVAGQVDRAFLGGLRSLIREALEHGPAASPVAGLAQG